MQVKCKTYNGMSIYRDDIRIYILQYFQVYFGIYIPRNSIVCIVLLQNAPDRERREPTPSRIPNRKFSNREDEPAVHEEERREGLH
ncbi:unnamed protein product [Camellia sinensis]